MYYVSVFQISYGKVRKYIPGNLNSFPKKGVRNKPQLRHLVVICVKLNVFKTQTHTFYNYRDRKMLISLQPQDKGLISTYYTLTMSLIKIKLFDIINSLHNIY